MNNISSIDNITKEYMYDSDFKTKLKTVLVGDAVECEKFYVNILGGGCMNEGEITDILLLNFKRRCFHELQPRNTQKAL